MTSTEDIQKVLVDLTMLQYLEGSRDAVKANITAFEELLKIRHPTNLTDGIIFARNHLTDNLEFIENEIKKRKDDNGSVPDNHSVQNQ